ncbi:MAG: SH3-like domain-containing protein [Kiloniellales bacterium]
MTGRVQEGRFQKGQRVRIADRDPPQHNRTPRYLRGQIGVVERVCPAFGQPELLAYGGDGEPFQTVYRVRLAQRDLWPDYAGPARDHLEVEIFEHWLESA